MFGTNEIVGQKYFKDAPTNSLFVTSMFFTLQGEGPFNGMPALFIRLTKCNLACSFCFVPCTEVTMGDKTKKRIDQIRVGDIVLSYNEKIKKYEQKKVLTVYQSSPEKLIRVKTNHGKVHCTPEHPFFANKEWIPANKLKIGDIISGYNSQYEEHDRIIEEVYELSDSEFINYNTSSDELFTYNLEVEDTHTYIANGCVVHNCDTFFDDGDWLTFEEIAVKATATIRKYWTDKGQEVPEWVELNSKELIGSFPRVVLVVTGGEPLLQKNLVDFLNYAQFRMRGSMFGNMQIESNGTVNQDVPEHVTLVCSPKCSEKNGVATKYLAPTELILNRADCLKFVMCSPHVSLDKNSEYPELSDMFRRAEVGISINPYSTVPEWAHKWKKETSKEIYVSPMNIYNSFPQKIKLLHAENKTISMEQRSTVDEIISFWEPGLLNLKDNQTNHEYAAKYCMEHGFRLNLQMHLYASLA